MYNYHVFTNVVLRVDVRGFWLMRVDGSTAWQWDYLRGLFASQNETADVSSNHELVSSRSPLMIDVSKA